jgi:metal-sulfur cluster biosynthetic enzyme
MHEEIAADEESRQPTTMTEGPARPAVAADVTGDPVPADGTPTSDVVTEALKNVYDPELGINIVDLGLVYDVKVDDAGDVDIEYTLTTMGCPIGPLIEDQMRSLLQAVPGVGEVRPEMVLRPAWSPEMMSDEAKAALGIF